MPIVMALTLLHVQFKFACTNTGHEVYICQINRNMGVKFIQLEMD